jgi:hypothetical protein
MSFHASSPVRRRSINYILNLKENGYKNELPREQAIEFFSETSGFYDRLTIKAYFGTVAHRSKRKFYQDSQYASGTTTHKTITLSQEIIQSKGYLEKMGLVSYHLKGNVWFMKIENAVLTPELGRSSHEFMKNLSLSPLAQVGSFGKDHEKISEGCPAIRDELETKQKLENERDKSVSEIVPVLNPLELSILKAKETEPKKLKSILGILNELP